MNLWRHSGLGQSSARHGGQFVHGGVSRVETIRQNRFDVAYQLVPSTIQLSTLMASFNSLASGAKAPRLVTGEATGNRRLGRGTSRLPREESSAARSSATVGQKPMAHLCCVRPTTGPAWSVRRMRPERSHGGGGRRARLAAELPGSPPRPPHAGPRRDQPQHRR